MQLMACDEGWRIHRGAPSGEGSSAHPVFAWALTDDGRVEPCWWDGEAERAQVGAQGWPVTAPGEPNPQLAGAAAAARAWQYEEDDAD